MILSHHYQVFYAADGVEAMEMLTQGDQGYALILLDLMMPRMNGFEFLEQYRENSELKRIPVIVMTSEKEAEVKSIRLGAADFITKPYEMPEVILARCERIIELSEDKSIIRSTEKDPVTGLFSREYFFEYIRRILPDVNEPMDAVALNVDHFRLINEISGRSEGNRVLACIGDLITSVILTEGGFACRAEADTFFAYCKHREDYEELMEKVREELAAMYQAMRIRVRVGVYENVNTEQLPEMWFDHAKQACDRIRGDYARQVERYSDKLHERTLYRERLINDIQEAIDQHHFTVYYQPKYLIQEDEPRLNSAEALVRWNHPELGMISPGEFIPLFESNGLIQKLDNFVWGEAAAQISSWKEQYGISVPVSVNVSRIDIYDPDLEKKLVGILKASDLTPDELMLEITETAYSDNGTDLVKVVEHMRSQGFKIEMDDFGSGYSSLNMLTTLPIDVLKLDMKFIRNMMRDEKSLRMVQLIMDIAKFLKVPVVAEGVEDEQQLNTLKEMGCEFIQGYYFSRPVPPEEFAPFIEKEVARRKRMEEQS